MPITQMQPQMWVDDDMPDGYVEIVGGRLRGMEEIFMSRATYFAISFGGHTERLWDTVQDMRGTVLLPRAVIEPDAAADLQQGLSFVEPEPSEVCIYPPCSLPAEVVHGDGFPLCAGHAELLSTWDDLVA